MVGGKRAIRGSSLQNKHTRTVYGTNALTPYDFMTNQYDPFKLHNNPNAAAIVPFPNLIIPPDQQHEAMSANKLRMEADASLNGSIPFADLNKVKRKKSKKRKTSKKAVKKGKVTKKRKNVKTSKKRKTKKKAA